LYCIRHDLMNYLLYMPICCVTLVYKDNNNVQAIEIQSDMCTLKSVRCKKKKKKKKKKKMGGSVL
jgi:hypothetical protein